MGDIDNDLLDNFKNKVKIYLNIDDEIRCQPL